MSAETPELVICVDAQIPIRGADFFLRMVAETPSLDALRILYVSASFSRSISMNGNGSFRSYSRSDPGSFRSYSLSVRLFRPGSFWPDFRSGSFLPNFGGSFRPTLFYIVFRL